MGVTKTDFMRGMQCPRMLWLDKHHPELKVIPPMIQKKLDKGNEFGDEAMAMFGAFEEMTVFKPGTTYPDKKAMVLLTREHLDKCTSVICEAAFDYNGNYCAVDILKKVPGGYEMYEVKNSPEVTDQFIKDAGFQAYILRHCGLNLLRINIVYHGEDENNPFEIQDITTEANAYAPIVEANIDRLAAVKVQKAEVCCSCGDQCREPYECWYFGHCHQVQH